MLGLHILLAIALAAFSNALSPLGIALAFFLTYLVLKLGAAMTGASTYLRRLESGLCFIFWYVKEVFKASIDVARVVFGSNCNPAPAIIKMRLRRRDDRMATLVGLLLTLTPGTMALEYNSDTGELFIHALDAHSVESIEGGVREIETRLLAWMGIDADELEVDATEEEKA